MSILIQKATILTQNSKREVFKGDIFIEEDQITEISKRPLSLEAEYSIDGSKKLALPGFINLHTHIPMTLLRGYGDDMLLNPWLEKRIWPVEAKLDEHSVKIGTRLGLLEMIASGTTSYLDMYFFENIIGKVTEKIGLRGFLGFAVIDAGTPEYPADELMKSAERFVKTWKTNQRVQPVIAPHAAYTCGPETLEQCRDLSEKNDILLHIHCSETRDEIYQVQQQFGVRPVEHLKKYGLLNKRMILAHCGWITKNEILDINKAGSSVVHCPVSNMKIGTGGFTPVPELLDIRVPVGWGTDGAASNNVLDMFDTMKFCALVHKQHRWDPSVLPAQTVVDCATIKGAQCLGMEDRLGSIEEGKQADVIMLDLQKPHLTPRYSLVSHLVYAARGSDVCTSIVGGRLLMHDHQFLTVDYQKTLDDALKCADELTN